MVYLSGLFVLAGAKHLSAVLRYHLRNKGERNFRQLAFYSDAVRRRVTQLTYSPVLRNTFLISHTSMPLLYVVTYPI